MTSKKPGSIKYNVEGDEDKLFIDLSFLKLDDFPLSLLKINKNVQVSK